MKTSLLLGFLLLFTAVHAQKIKPCDKWITDFIQVEPRLTDGTVLNKYVVDMLKGDTGLKSETTCMVGLRIYVNCKGEFSYEKETYPNSPDLTTQCNKLQQKVNRIMKGIKSFTPSKTDEKTKDFVFKLVVWVKHDGEPGAEILF